MNNTQLNILKTEIDEDSLSIGYSTMGNWEIAESINSLTRTSVQNVPLEKIYDYIIFSNIWPDIISAANTSTHVVYKQALNTKELFNAYNIGGASLDTDKTKFQNVLSNFVSAGIMTSTQKQEIVDLGNADISRAEELGLPKVTGKDVAEARSL